MRALTSPQPHIVREQHPGEDGVNKKKNNEGTVAAPPPLPRLYHHRPQFGEKGPPSTGDAAAQTEDETTVRKIKITSRDASIAQSTAGTV